MLYEVLLRLNLKRLQTLLSGLRGGRSVFLACSPLHHLTFFFLDMRYIRGLLINVMEMVLLQETQEPKFCLSVLLHLSLSLSLSLSHIQLGLPPFCCLLNHIWKITSGCGWWWWRITDLDAHPSYVSFFPSLLFIIPVSWHTSVSSFKSKADNTPLYNPYQLFLLTCFESFLHFKEDCRNCNCYFAEITEACAQNLTFLCKW